MNKVVNLSYPEPEIALVAMEDKASRNTFSPELVSGLISAFEEIEVNQTVKVVITVGFDSYYACGGTLEELKTLASGEKTFEDIPIFKLPLMCKLPTIAAVQGHAIGGGLAFACMHDFLILSRAAIYSANFMSYGFTPGMASTYTIPKKFGSHCGNQMLFTAKRYSGKELEQMNVLLPFYSRENVLDEAMDLARSIADKTITSIQLLKEQTSGELRAKLPEIVKTELAMHAKTITTEEAQHRIEKMFGE